MVDCLSARVGSNPVVTADNMARSSNGSGCETLILAIRVRFPYGLLNMAKWRNLVYARRSERRVHRTCEFDPRLGYFGFQIADFRLQIEHAAARKSEI